MVIRCIYNDMRKKGAEITSGVNSTPGLPINLLHQPTKTGHAYEPSGLVHGISWSAATGKDETLCSPVVASPARLVVCSRQTSEITGRVSVESQDCRSIQASRDSSLLARAEPGLALDVHVSRRSGDGQNACRALARSVLLLLTCSLSMLVVISTHGCSSLCSEKGTREGAWGMVFRCSSQGSTRTSRPPRH